MRNTILIALVNILFLGYSSLTAQNRATNVRVKVDSEKIEYTFDIPKSTVAKIYNINLNTGNVNFKPKSVNGIRNNEGADRKITWLYAADGYKKEDIINLQIQVEAMINESATKAIIERETGAQKKYNMAKLGAITMGVGGLSVLTLGVLKEFKAKKDYNFYKSNDRRSNAYTGTTRDDVYTKANEQHKKAQYLMLGGGVLFTGATAWFWISRKQYKTIRSVGITKGGFEFVDPNAGGLTFNFSNNSEAPLSLVYKF
jgi:hypothetical protein